MPKCASVQRLIHQSHWSIHHTGISSFTACDIDLHMQLDLEHVLSH